MKRRVASLFAIALCVGACASAHNDAAARQRGKQIWQRNVTIVEESVEFWKRRTGTAPYTPKELEDAIDFFERLTGIHGGNMSFIGPIPDESLEKVSDQWKAWYAVHGDHLVYDASKRRVIVKE
jgi:hypothetical protein